MDRNGARAAFAASGLTYDVLTKEAVEDLRKRINAEMKESGVISGTYRMTGSSGIRETPRGRIAELRCKARHFEDREAVTFNPDGFIGFAGWADDSNVAPILRAFVRWVEACRAGNEPAAETAAARP